jgi:hypothetical protein
MQKKGTPPYGYRREGGRLVVEQAAAAGVRLAFDVYLATGSLVKAAVALNTAGYRTTAGEIWRYETIRTVLTNPTYGGESLESAWRMRGGWRPTIIAILKDIPTWRLTPGEHEAIVSPEVTARAREIYWQSRRADIKPGPQHEIRPWAGLVICKFCGSKLLRYVPRGAGQTFRCPGHIFGGCEMRAVPEPWLDHEVVMAISAVLSDAMGEQPLTIGDTRLTKAKTLYHAWASIPDTPEGSAVSRRLLQALISHVIVGPDEGEVFMREIRGLALPERIVVQRWPKRARYAAMIGRWSVRYDLCQGCGGIERAHFMRGRCAPCYAEWRRSGQGE